MTSISLKDLRRRLGKLLRERKPILLTRRGEPIAKIVPLGRRGRSADLTSILERFAGAIDDPGIPSDGSTRLDDYLYGPTRPRR